jgi:hypothetical protein
LWAGQAYSTKLTKFEYLKTFIHSTTTVMSVHIIRPNYSPSRPATPTTKSGLREEMSKVSRDLRTVSQSRNGAMTEAALLASLSHLQQALDEVEEREKRRQSELEQLQSEQTTVGELYSTQAETSWADTTARVQGRY